MTKFTKRAREMTAEEILAELNGNHEYCFVPRYNPITKIVEVV